MEEPNSETEKPPGLRWRLAAKLGFWFFFIKGLLWLILPALGLWLGWEITHDQ